MEKYIFRIDKYENEGLTLFKQSINVLVEANEFREASEKVSAYMRENKIKDVSSHYVDTIQVSI
jgi:hypothetical protein